MTWLASILLVIDERSLAPSTVLGHAFGSWLAVRYFSDARAEASSKGPVRNLSQQVHQAGSVTGIPDQ